MHCCSSLFRRGLPKKAGTRTQIRIGFRARGSDITGAVNAIRDILQDTTNSARYIKFGNIISNIPARLLLAFVT